jgi:large subunit ribosomal protein L23
MKEEMDILVKPLVTEKMTAQTEKLNRFGFVVDRRASKDQIKAAVESMYDVKVVSVNTIIVAGKTKSRYTKSGVQKGKTSSFKKALITLDEGQTIDFYSNI